MAKVELSIIFDGHQPKRVFKCGYGQPMTYGITDLEFPHRDFQMKVPNVPAWLCPSDCPRFAECKGSLRILTKQAGDQIIKAVVSFD